MAVCCSFPLHFIFIIDSGEAVCALTTNKSLDGDGRWREVLSVVSVRSVCWPVKKYVVSTDAKQCSLCSTDIP